MQRCLGALARSTARETTEVIVVDSGSLDACPQLDETYPWATFMRLPRNFGLTRARNIGTRTATGQFIFFLNPRVEVGEGTIAALAEALGSQEEAVAVSACLRNSEGQVVSKAYLLPSPADLKKIWKERIWPAPRPLTETAESVTVEWISADAMMIRALFLRGMNYLDERYAQYWSDLELCYQIRRSGKRNLLVMPVTATLHDDETERVGPRGRAVLAADEGLGAATYIAKHHGFAAATLFRISLILSSFVGFIGSLLKAKEVSFQWTRFASLVMGQRVDGSQAHI